MKSYNYRFLNYKNENKNKKLLSTVCCSQRDISYTDTLQSFSLDQKPLFFRELKF